MSSLQLETGLPRIRAETFWNNLQSKHREEKQKTLTVFQTVTDQACERDQKVSSSLPGRAQPQVANFLLSVPIRKHLARGRSSSSGKERANPHFIPCCTFLNG